MTLPVLTNLPAWTVSYRYAVNPSQSRTSNSVGAKIQAKRSNRKSTIASVTRSLRGAELSYFEWFVRSICNDGASKFTDSYQDQNGLSSGLVRIVDGSYSVETDTRNHTISCELEIFR